MGYSNLEKLVVTGSFQKSNFSGLGFNMNAAINWSSLRQQGNLSFFDPYFLDSRCTLSVDAFAINRQFQVTNDEFQRGGSIAVGRYLDPATTSSSACSTPSKTWGSTTSTRCGSGSWGVTSTGTASPAPSR